MPGELSVIFMRAHSELAVSSNSSLGLLVTNSTGNSSQYLEGPNITWKDHDRNIFCPDGPQDSYHGPSRYYLVLPGTE